MPKRSSAAIAISVAIAAAGVLLLLYAVSMSATTGADRIPSSSLISLLQSPDSVRSESSSMSWILDWRKQLYEKMSRDLEEHGAAFLKGGETSQSLSLSDIFELRDGNVTPLRKTADPPVRATVLYLSSDFSVPISKAVREIFLPYFDGVIWFQNTSIYHSSMFHASHHLTSIVATDDEIESEAEAVKAVADTLCPLKIVLDRVVLTSTGVLLGCWQITSGSDPAVIRAKLRNALPRAPEKQLYDTVLLHTSFARLLGHPKVQLEKVGKPSNPRQLFHELVKELNDKLQGFEATMSELWFVEEYDVLALALNGRMKIRRFHLSCKEN